MGLIWKIGFGKENGWYFRVYFVPRRVEGVFFLFFFFFLPLFPRLFSFSSILFLCLFNKVLIHFACSIIHLRFIVWGFERLLFDIHLLVILSQQVLVIPGLSVFGTRSSIFFLCYPTSCISSKRKKMDYWCHSVLATMTVKFVAHFTYSLPLGRSCSLWSLLSCWNKSFSNTTRHALSYSDLVLDSATNFVIWISWVGYQYGIFRDCLSRKLLQR